MTLLRGLDLDALNSIADFVTAVIAFVAMVRVGHQNWRRPHDMHARRVILGVLASVAMTKALTTNVLPDVGLQLALDALLIAILIGSEPRSGPTPTKA